MTGPDMRFNVCGGGGLDITLLSAKFEWLDDLKCRLQADLDNICETFNVERRSIKFEKWRTTP